MQLDEISNDVNNKLLKLLNERYGIDFSKIEDTFCIELLGEKIGFNASDLLYLFFDIQKEFDILIPEEDVIEGKFNNINNICKIVTRQLKE